MYIRYAVSNRAAPRSMEAELRAAVPVSIATSCDLLRPAMALRLGAAATAHNSGRRGAIFPLLEIAFHVPSAAAFSRRPERTPGGSEGTQRSRGFLVIYGGVAPHSLYVRAASGTNQNGARRRPLGTAPTISRHGWHTWCAAHRWRAPVQGSRASPEVVRARSVSDARDLEVRLLFSLQILLCTGENARRHQRSGRPQNATLLVEGTRNNTRRSAPPRRFRMRAPR